MTYTPHPKPTNPKFIDIEGQVFGWLTVVGFAGTRKKKHTIWHCACECGSVLPVDGSHLKTGHTKSCGCYRSSADNLSTTPEYKILKEAIRRCDDPDHPAYANYGGRGISVFDGWRQNTGSFIAHLGGRPTCYHTLDRIDNDGNYEPGNVRWASRKEQGRNRRGNKIVTVHGQEMCLSEACEKYDKPYRRTWKRLYLGWTVERALFT